MHIMKSSLQCQKQIRIFNLKGREILKKKNKYEDIEMIDLDDKAEISDIYIEHLYNTDKTVGLVAGKELTEYVLQNVINLEETSVKEINFIDLYDINEYLIFVNDEGHIVAAPINELYVLDDVDIIYIDMDGDISQDIIDYCVNEDKEVILFGQEDDCDGGCENCPANDETYLHISEDEDGNTHGFTASKSDGDSYMSYSYYSSDELSHEDIQNMLKAFGF